jgi:EAL domain-containing protein (putative c-di-GMP-specific phosphodiesterase class I)
MQAPASRAAKFSAELHSAIDRREFLLRYQPQITNGLLDGFEVLLAWNHPVRGPLRAAEFVPVAEANGLIIPIGSWVIDQACRQISRWSQAGNEPVQVAVNISALQFERPDFVEVVAGALREHSVRPGQLELEITESALMRDARQSARVMLQLQDLGVRFAIDDFGTGYSSLSYLNRLPVDRLKIDRSFLHEADPLETVLPTLKAIVTLAHSLGLTVVGEGVERVDQLKLLEEAGCDTIQGHLYSRPVDIDSATRMLIDHRLRHKPRDAG